MKLCNLIFIFHLLSVSVNSQSIVWDYERCVSHALKNNISLKQKLLQYEIASLDLQKSKLDFLPTFGFGTGVSIGLGRSIDPFTNDFTNDPVFSTSGNASINLSVFEGFQKWNNLKKNRIKKNSAELEKEQSERDTRILIASNYLQLLFSSEKLQNDLNELEILQKQLAIANKKLKVGRIPKSNIYELQSSIAQEELDILQSENKVFSNRTKLKEILQLDDTESFSIADPKLAPPDGEIIAYTFESIKDQIKKFPEYNINQNQIQTAKLNKSQALLNMLPSISVSYGAGSSVISNRAKFIPSTNGEDPTTVKLTIDEQLRENFNQSIGININLPFLNSTNHIARNKKRAKIALEQALLQSKLETDRLLNDLNQLLVDAQVAYKSYKISQERQKVLDETYIINASKYNTGRVGYIDYITAKNNREAGKNTLLQNKYESVLKIKILKFYMGIPINFN